MMPAGEI